MRWFDDFVAFDLETTGLKPEFDRICQAAAVRFVEFEERSRFSTYVDPGVPIPEGINAVSNDDVRGAPVFADVAGEIVRSLLAANVVLVYSAPFDVPFLVAELRRAGFRVPLVFDVERTLDPLVWVRDVDKYVRGKGRHRLETTASRRGVSVEGIAHDAGIDCLLLAGVARSLKNDVIGDLDQLLRWQNQIREDQRLERKACRDRIRADRVASS